MVVNFTPPASLSPLFPQAGEGDKVSLREARAKDATTKRHQHAARRTFTWL
jgi:hypothetical protein